MYTIIESASAVQLFKKSKVKGRSNS